MTPLPVSNPMSAPAPIGTGAPGADAGGDVFGLALAGLDHAGPPTPETVAGAGIGAIPLRVATPDPGVASPSLPLATLTGLQTVFAQAAGISAPSTIPVAYRTPAMAAPPRYAMAGPNAAVPEAIASLPIPASFKASPPAASSRTAVPITDIATPAVEALPAPVAPESAPSVMTGEGTSLIPSVTPSTDAKTAPVAETGKAPRPVDPEFPLAIPAPPIRAATGSIDTPTPAASTVKGGAARPARGKTGEAQAAMPVLTAPVSLILPASTSINTQMAAASTIATKRDAAKSAREGADDPGPAPSTAMVSAPLVTPMLAPSPVIGPPIEKYVPADPVSPPVAAPSNAVTGIMTPTAVNTAAALPNSPAGPVGSTQDAVTVPGDAAASVAKPAIESARDNLSSFRIGADQAASAAPARPLTAPGPSSAAPVVTVLPNAASGRRAVRPMASHAQDDSAVSSLGAEGATAPAPPTTGRTRANDTPLPVVTAMPPSGPAVTPSKDGAPGSPIGADASAIRGNLSARSAAETTAKQDIPATPAGIRPHVAPRPAVEMPTIADSGTTPAIVAASDPPAPLQTPPPSHQTPAFSAAPTATVAARPGQIGHEMGVAIARHVTAGGGEALAIRLNPGEMGRIEVHLTLDEHGTLRAVIAADNPASLEMLRRDSADLSRALTDAGLRADAQSLRFDARGSGGQTGNGGSGHAPWQGRQDARGQAADTPATPSAPVWRPLNTRGRIDLMA